MQHTTWGLHIRSLQGHLLLVNARAGLCSRHRGNGIHGLQQQSAARKACNSRARARVRTNVHGTHQAGLPGAWSSIQTVSPEEPTAAEKLSTLGDAAPTGPRRRQNPEASASPIQLYETTAQRHKRADYAPGTRVGEDVQVLLARQLRDLMKNPIPGISVAPDESNIMTWHAVLSGPEGSPYVGGLFEVDLTFTLNFPGEQPYIHFRTKIWHPNIEPDGHTCVAMGQLPDDPLYIDHYSEFSGGYKVRSVACILIGLQMLLSTPNPNSPVNSAAGDQMNGDRKAFDRKAMKWTRMYAH